MRKGIYVAVIVSFLLMCVLPTSLYAQRTRPAVNETDAGAYETARMDAREDVSAIKWLGCGCIGTIFAPGIAYLSGASPDEARFVGKSSDYIYTYTRTYKRAVRSYRTKYAMIGCGVTGVFATVGCIIAASQETFDPSCGLDDACADPLGLNGCLESFEGSGCYEPGTGCKAPDGCQDEIDCATGESCGSGTSCGSTEGCGSSSSSTSCGGSAEYLTR